jgi:hypothetical protein
MDSVLIVGVFQTGAKPGKARREVIRAEPDLEQAV